MRDVRVYIKQHQTMLIAFNQKGGGGGGGDYTIYYRNLNTYL